MGGGRRFRGHINSGGDDEVFVYWWLDATTRRFTVYRRDGCYRRGLAVPPGRNPPTPQATAGFDLFLTRDGDRLVVRQLRRVLKDHATLDNSAAQRWRVATAIAARQLLRRQLRRAPPRRWRWPPTRTSVRMAE